MTNTLSSVLPANEPTERTHITVSSVDADFIRGLRPGKFGTLPNVIGILLKKLTLTLKQNGITDASRQSDFIAAVIGCDIVLGKPNYISITDLAQRVGCTAPPLSQEAAKPNDGRGVERLCKDTTTASGLDAKPQGVDGRRVVSRRSGTASKKVTKQV